MGRSESLERWSLFWFRAVVNGRICPWIIAQDLVITKRGKRVRLNFSNGNRYSWNRVPCKLIQSHNQSHYFVFIPLPLSLSLSHASKLRYDRFLAHSHSHSVTLAHQHLIYFGYPVERIYGFWHICLHVVINHVYKDIHGVFLYNSLLSKFL